MVTEEQIKLIQQQFQSKGKIACIKLYREFTDASLLDAKEQIEQFLNNGELGESSNQGQSDFDLDDALMDSILNAIQDGNKVKAVKIYKDATGNSLKPSKEFIEKLMHELALADPESVGKSGCVLLLLVLVTIVGLVL
jgi:ribosomal protein L7/L12